MKALSPKFVLSAVLNNKTSHDLSVNVHYRFEGKDPETVDLTGEVKKGQSMAIPQRTKSMGTWEATAHISQIHVKGGGKEAHISAPFTVASPARDYPFDVKEENAALMIVEAAPLSDIAIAKTKNTVHNSNTMTKTWTHHDKHGNVTGTTEFEACSYVTDEPGNASGLQVVPFAAAPPHGIHFPAGSNAEHRRWVRKDTSGNVVGTTEFHSYSYDSTKDQQRASAPSTTTDSSAVQHKRWVQKDGQGKVTGDAEFKSSTAAPQQQPPAESNVTAAGAAQQPQGAPNIDPMLHELLHDMHAPFFSGFGFRRDPFSDPFFRGAAHDPFDSFFGRRTGFW